VESKLFLRFIAHISFREELSARNSRPGGSTDLHGNQKFIISKFDYCSTLFFHFQDAVNEQRLDKNFSKSLKSYLNIKLHNLNILEQNDHLKSFRLMPLRLG
jgi:hypothetical protein